MVIPQLSVSTIDYISRNNILKVTNAFLLGILLVSIFILGSCRSNHVSSNSDIVGNTYKVLLERETKSSGDGSSGSSRTRLSVIERVIDRTEEGLILEYNHSANITEEEKLIEWQLPARILFGKDETSTLLNSDQLEVRLSKWLELAEIDPSACGTWYFTWNAFKVECDPQSAIDIIKPFNLNGRTRNNGDEYNHVGMNTAGLLSLVERIEDKKVLETEIELDPNFIRKQYAERDVVVSQLVGDTPFDLEEAILNLENFNYEGLVKITLRIDENGNVYQKVTSTTIKTIDESGSVSEDFTREEVTKTLVVKGADRG